MKKVLQKVLRRVLRRELAMGFTVKRGGSQKGLLEEDFHKVPRTPPRRVRPLRRAPYLCLSGTESALLNRESCDSKVAAKH